MEKISNPYAGRTREDMRFFQSHYSMAIRHSLSQVRAMTQLPNKRIAEEILGISSSTLSMAVGGRAGFAMMYDIACQLNNFVVQNHE